MGWNIKYVIFLYSGQYGIAHNTHQRSAKTNNSSQPCSS